jgi:hypothetical protein
VALMYGNYSQHSHCGGGGGAFDFCPTHKSVDWTDQKQSSGRISAIVRS